MRSKTRHGHMNFDEIVALINGRTGIRFGRVAWGADKWMMYMSKDDMRCMWDVDGILYMSSGSYIPMGQGKRDWIILQNADGSMPEL